MFFIEHAYDSRMKPGVPNPQLGATATLPPSTSQSQSWALLGAGGSALNGASNALVADLFEDPSAKSAALNRVGLFFGFGALFIPFTIGLLLRAVGLRFILVAGAAFCLLVALANASRTA